jgi:HK97 family phage prohead protease
MAEMIKKLLDVDIKEAGERVLQFIGSSETPDRDGEVILSSGWDLKNYKKNPVFLWAHRYDQPPVGRATKVKVKDGQLVFDVEFAPRETYEFADTIYKLYKGGFLHATSVGFLPIDFEDGDGQKTPRRTFKKQELLELSGCPVPSQPDALRLACDSGVVTVKQLQDAGLITKPEVTENYIRIPVPSEEGKHGDHRIRTITISEKEKIKALYCGECKVIITYLFDREKWDMERARRWVSEHSKSVIVSVTTNSENDEEEVNAYIQPDGIIIHSPMHIHKFSQAEIRDEIDYLKTMLQQTEPDDKTKESLEVFTLWMPTAELTESVTTPEVKIESKSPSETFDYLELARRVANEVINKK